jgi:hypothetical protein
MYRSDQEWDSENCSPTFSSYDRFAFVYSLSASLSLDYNQP